MSPDFLPRELSAFLERALPVLRADSRVLGVAAGGSFRTGHMDEHSDLDLVIGVEPVAFDAVMSERQAIAASIGGLLVSFTGEHVGEPRLLIGLYAGTPAVHVDFKFVRLPDLAERVEDPVILWDRDGRFTAALQSGEAQYPAPDAQWIEDRFWIWIHYGAGKIARGEWFEALSMLSWLRFVVLGPLALERAGVQPNGVRRLESAVPEFAERLRTTLATYDGASIWNSLVAAVALYQELRQPAVRHHAAERAALDYLHSVRPR
jgi:PAS domain-containing protein